MKYIIKINELKYKNRTIKIKNNILITVIYDGKTFNIDYPILNISICEKDLETAIKSFNEDFIFLYDTYYIENDNNLTEDAKIYKKIISDIL